MRAMRIADGFRPRTDPSAITSCCISGGRARNAFPAATSRPFISVKMETASGGLEAPSSMDVTPIPGTTPDKGCVVGAEYAVGSMGATVGCGPVDKAAGTEAVMAGCRERPRSRPREDELLLLAQRAARLSRAAPFLREDELEVELLFAEELELFFRFEFRPFWLRSLS
mmetsp:Transcript_79700/g.179768  ORF Transcript_79700/g.179768 Transcript_79700/m.179768 type:complete len:169 (-) Transcript_79700:137-643(-)